MIVSLGLLFEALSAIFCLHYLYGKKVKFDVLTLGFVVSEILWMLSIYYFKWNPNWSLLMYLIMAIYCGLEFGFKLTEIIVNNILSMIIISIVQATVLLIYSIGATEVGILNQLFINVLVFLIVVVGLKKLSLHKVSLVLQAKDKLIIFALGIIIINLVIFIFPYKQRIGFDILYYIVFFISIILIGFVSLDIGKHKVKMNEAEAELRLHKLYESSFQNLIDEVRARQHEFDNHINAIYSQHYAHHSYEELVAVQKEYCKQIEKENHYNKLLSNGNPIVLCFLYSKFLEAEKAGIEVTYKVAIQNLDCNVPVYKMVELLGNLLKNAIEALEVSTEEKKLHVTMIEEEEFIRIEVGNVVKSVNYGEIQKFFERGYSKKGDNRGYGLYNVKKICEEYKIALKCERRELKRKWLYFVLEISKSL